MSLSPTLGQTNLPIATLQFEEAPTFSVQLFNSIHQVASDWEAVAQRGDVFWQRRYLASLESCPLPDVKPYFVVLYQSAVPIGILFFQRKYIRASESMSLEAPRNGSLSHCFRSIITDRLSFDILFCGNLLLTGNYGSLFLPQVPSKAPTLDRIMNVLSQYFDTLGSKPDLFFIKDLPPHQTLSATATKGYKSFYTYPDMVQTLKPEWTQFDHYTQALTSKYRTRSRRALKSLPPITCRHIAAHEVAVLDPQLHRLYKAVIGEADFHIIQLPENYFSVLQAALNVDFEIHGYFDANETLVGFISTIKNGTVLEAHFLGYEAQLNLPHQLYHNMLLKLIDLGIQTGNAAIHFARTATEIKSSVGAEPVAMICYFKHRKKTVNTLLQMLFGYVHTDVPWTPRNPFGDSSGIEDAMEK